MWHSRNMPKKIDYNLSPAEQSLIEKAAKSHSDLRVRQRAQIIRQLHQGKKPKEVAEIFSVTAATVYNCHKRWREEGLEGLSDAPRPGRTKKGGAEYVQALEETIEIEPRDAGYGFNIWTLDRLIAHLAKETGVTVCKNTLRERLNRLDYVYRRPKHDLTNLQDLTAKEQAEELISELKKRQKQARSNYSLWTKQPSG